MSRHTVTLDTDGPQTREELCDAIKAHVILLGYEPKSLYLPLATYMNWTRWPADEQGVADGAKPVFPADEIPEKIMGMNLYIANKFRMC